MKQDGPVPGGRGPLFLRCVCSCCYISTVPSPRDVTQACFIRPSQTLLVSAARTSRSTGSETGNTAGPTDRFFRLALFQLECKSEPSWSLPWATRRLLLFSARRAHKLDSFAANFISSKNLSVDESLPLMFISLWDCSIDAACHTLRRTKWSREGKGKQGVLIRCIAATDRQWTQKMESFTHKDFPGRAAELRGMFQIDSALEKRSRLSTEPNRGDVLSNPERETGCRRQRDKSNPIRHRTVASKKKKESDKKFQPLDRITSSPTLRGSKEVTGPMILRETSK